VIRCLAILSRINALASYVRLIEKKYATAEGLPGWRTYFAEHGRGKVTRVVSLSWFILLTATIIVPILVNSV